MGVFYSLAVLHYVRNYVRDQGHSSFVGFYCGILSLAPARRNLRYLNKVKTPADVRAFIHLIGALAVDEKGPVTLAIQTHARTFKNRLQYLSEILWSGVTGLGWHPPLFRILGIEPFCEECQDEDTYLEVGSPSVGFSHDRRKCGFDRTVALLGPELLLSFPPFGHVGSLASGAALHAKLIATLLGIYEGASEANDILAFGLSRHLDKLDPFSVVEDFCDEHKFFVRASTSYTALDARCRAAFAGHMLFGSIIDSEEYTSLALSYCSGKICFCNVYGNIYDCGDDEDLVHCDVPGFDSFSTCFDQFSEYSRYVPFSERNIPKLSSV